MKKYTNLIIAAALALAMTACTENTNPSTAESTATASAEEITTTEDKPAGALGAETGPEETAEDITDTAENIVPPDAAR